MDSLVDANDLGRVWSLSLHHLDEDSFTLTADVQREIGIVSGGIDPATGEITYITLDKYIEVSDPPLLETFDLIKAWQLFCYTLDGPEEPADCAESVAAARFCHGISYLPPSADQSSP